MRGGGQQTSFSGHETFPFRYPWLKKGFDAVCDDGDVFLRDDGDVFLRDDAMTILGVGKNMVRSIRHWCLAAGVIETNQGEEEEVSLLPTTLGELCLSPMGLSLVNKMSPQNIKAFMMGG